MILKPTIHAVRLSCFLALALAFDFQFTVPDARAQTSCEPSDAPPPIPIGADAFTQWSRWPYLRIGVRSYMRSTFDRSGGNDNADAAHFIRQVDDTHNVALDE